MKGQASVETLIIFAFALIVLIIVFSFSSQSVSDLNKEKLVETAKTSVASLKNAANDVYTQGVGARKQVFFVVPQGVEPTNSGIVDKAIVLNLFGTDVFATSSVALSGEIPTTPGGHWVWVTSFENYVAIGVQSISVDKTSVFVSLSQNDSVQDTFTVSNNATETATITITQNWSHPNVTLDVAPPIDVSFNLDPGQQQIVTLTFNANSVAVGNHSGSLNIGAVFSSWDENISLPLNAEVIAVGGGQANLIVLPLTYSVSLDAGSTDTNAFQVCNNSQQALNDIAFTFSGAISTWINLIPNIASLDAGVCQTVSFTINVPAVQAAGIYSGNITATDQGGLGPNSDSIAITVQVSEAPIALFATIDFINDGDHVFTWISENTFSGEDSNLGLNGELDRNYLNSAWNANLAGYWKFNSQTAGSVADFSGNSHGGTLVNGASVSAQGLWDTTAGTFNGTNQHLRVNNHPDFDMSNQITVAAWMNATTTTPLGIISDTIIDSLEFDALNGVEPSIVKVAGNIYAIAYTGTADDGFVVTAEINPGGTINNAIIDSLEFDISNGLFPSLIQVSANVFAVAYQGPASDGFVKTFTIDPTGIISNSTIDSLEFDISNGVQPDIAFVSGNIFAIAYSGPASDGFTTTVQIDASGNISNSVIDRIEFDISDARSPSILQVSSGIFAIAYYQSILVDGIVATIQIDTSGNISNSVIDSLTFDTVNGVTPFIAQVAGNTYAIAYSGPDADGFIVTTQIDATGNISPTIDTLEFDTVNALSPAIINAGQGIFAIAYSGLDADGFIVTTQIDASGNISTVIDTLEFDPLNGQSPTLVAVFEDVFAIAYTGDATDGFIATVEIVLEKGIFKRGTFGLDSDTSNAFGIINGQKISAPISSGWNQIVLTYDKDAPVDQQKLFVNGAQVAAGTLTDSINITLSDIIMGKYFNGTIEEVSVWNRALSSTQVQSIYNNSFQGYFDAIQLDSTASDTSWASVFINGNINPTESCIDLIYGADNSLPVALTNSITCIALDTDVILPSATGRYMDFQVVFRNNINGNSFATPYLSDMNFTYYLS